MIIRLVDIGAEWADKDFWVTILDVNGRALLHIEVNGCRTFGHELLEIEVQALFLPCWRKYIGGNRKGR